MFVGDEDVAGIDVGSYSDFNALREYVATTLEHGKPGSRFPVFVLHSDSEGSWRSEELPALRAELKTIVSEMERQPPLPFASPWQDELAAELGIRATNACQSFIDVDGELLLHRLLELICVAEESHSEIRFQ